MLPRAAHKEEEKQSMRQMRRAIKDKANRQGQIQNIIGRRSGCGGGGGLWGGEKTKKGRRMGDGKTCHWRQLWCRLSRSQ